MLIQITFVVIDNKIAYRKHKEYVDKVANFSLALKSLNVQKNNYNVFKTKRLFLVIENAVLI